MNGLFDFSKGMASVFEKVEKLTFLIILNLLTIVCCIPLFTIGAALTAAHSTALRMQHNAEGSIVKNYFRLFKENFGQSTIIWLFIVFAAGVSILDLLLIEYLTTVWASIMRVAVIFGLVMLVFVCMWVFPIQARFENKISRTIKNALTLSYAHIFRTLYMIVLGAIPIAIALTSITFTPLILFWGFSGPIYLSAKSYGKVFKQLEEAAQNITCEEH